MVRNDELSQEIQQLISLLVQQHVKSWYKTMSKDTELFSQFDILTHHVQQALAGRAACVDWQKLVLSTVPDLLCDHFQTINRAVEAKGVEHFAKAIKSSDQHRALRDVQAHLTQIAEGLLILLLPQEELMSDVALSFTRDLLADLILRTVIDRLSEPWFWDELLVKVDHEIRSKLSQSIQSTRYREILSSIGKDMYSRIARVQPIEEWISARPEQARPSSIYDTALSTLIKELLEQSELPLFTNLLLQIALPLVDIIAGKSIMQAVRRKIDVLATQTTLTELVRITRHVLFPNDTPSPERILPSQEEQVKIKLAAQACLPLGMNLPFMSHKEVNRDLVLKMLDLFMETLFPELLTRSPAQLKQNALAAAVADAEAVGAGGIRSRSAL